MPDKYYIDTKNHLRQIPEHRVNAYLKKYPGSREATNKELSDFENKRAEMQVKTPTNQPLNGQNTSFVPNQFNLNIPNYAEEFAKNKPEIGIGPNNTGNNTSLVNPFPTGKPLKVELLTLPTQIVKG